MASLLCRYVAPGTSRVADVAVVSIGGRRPCHH